MASNSSSSSSSNLMSITTKVALLLGVMVTVVACFSEEEPINNQKQFKRSLSEHQHSGESLRFNNRVGQCFEIISDDELLNELTLRRLERQRLNSHIHRSGDFGSSGHSLHQQPIIHRNGPSAHVHNVPVAFSPHHHHHEIIGGGFEEDSAGIIGGSFKKNQEHEHADLEDKKLELGHVSGSFSDVGASNKKVFEADSKGFLGKDKHLRFEEDANVHDKEGRFDGDLAKAEKITANLDHDRKSSSGKLGAAGIKHSSGGFAGAKSDLGR